MTLGWIKFALTALLFSAGLFVLAVSLFGTFKFRFALNRIHASAMNDTLVLMLFLFGAAVSSGSLLLSLKFLIIIAIQWIASPLASHMLVKFEYMTDEKLGEHCELPENGEENK